jgi:hypothetical protein
MLTAAMDEALADVRAPSLIGGSQPVGSWELVGA